MLTSLLLSSLLTIPTVFGQGGAGGGGVQYAGVNIPGMEFGCDTDGNCNTGGVCPPIPGVPGGRGDGAAQMARFSSQHKMNIFRLPVGWQYLTPSAGGPIDEEHFKMFDRLMQGCLQTGAKCILDIHNYGRWNGQIVGQGGPSADQFANLWGQLAGKYQASPNVVMGLMNEPHEVDINTWAQAVQAAVNAIRQAGANTQMILLPGNQWCAVGALLQSTDALGAVTDPAGGTDKLIFDVHNYFDGDNSGRNPECASNKIEAGFSQPVEWLRSHGRKALISELGGGGNAGSCQTMICDALGFINANSDVYLGWVAWAAGAFEPEYALMVLDPSGGDTPLMTNCFAGKFGGGVGLNVAAGGGGSGVGIEAGVGGVNASVGGGAGGGPAARLDLGGGGGAGVGTNLPNPLGVVSGVQQPGTSTLPQVGQQGYGGSGQTQTQQKGRCVKKSKRDLLRRRGRREMSKASERRV